MKKVKDTIKLVIILTVIIGGLGGLFYYMRLLEQIPDNPGSAVGNTPSNLFNNGLFCEDDGRVYFSNYLDSGALYSMNSDETDYKKLNKYATKWINAAGDYLYFYENADGADVIAGFGGHMMGIYRVKKNGSDLKCLDKTLSGTLALAGNYLYYEHYTNRNREGMTLYKLRIDKQEKGMVAREIIDPSCVQNGNIYYAGMNGDHTMYRLDTRTDGATAAYVGSVWNPVILDNGHEFIYMNVDDNYRLHRVNLDNEEDIRITDERVDCFNVAGEYIYYQKNSKSDPALMRCTINGDNPEVIMSGNFTSINSTSRYVYFQPYNDNTIMYHMAVSGPPNASIFNPEVDRN